MKLRVTRNSFLGNYYAKRIKADGSFSVFSSLPPSLRTRQLAVEAEVDVISPASLSMPLTYYIVFSTRASPKFPLFNKTEVTRLFFSFLFFPRVEGASTNLDPRGKFERSRAKLVLSRNNRARFIHRCGNAPLGNFPRKVFPGQKENFRASIL